MPFLAGCDIVDSELALRHGLVTHAWLSSLPWSQDWFLFNRCVSPAWPLRRRAITCESQKTTTGVAGVVTDMTLKSLVAKCDVPVLVDFWAPWCEPCRMIAPIIDQIAKDYGKKVRCLQLNTDESPNIATEYGICSIPTVTVFVKGERKDTIIGVVPMQTITNTLDKYMAWSE